MSNFAIVVRNNHWVYVVGQCEGLNIYADTSVSGATVEDVTAHYSRRVETYRQQRSSSNQQ